MPLRLERPVEAVALGALRLTPGVTVKDVLQRGVSLRCWDQRSAEHRWHGNLNLRKDGLDVARLMSECRSVMFSAGSACASGSGRPSHVLRAIGLTDAQAKSSIRLGFGRYTTAQEIEAGAAAILAAAKEQGL